MTCVKICLTGPESTGKSTLAEQLALHYKTSVSQEFARKYLDELAGKYNFEDLSIIAKGQINNQIAASKLAEENLDAFPMAIFDTDLLTIKIWAQDKFNKHISLVNEHWGKSPADLYLLCFPDLDWKEDKQREDPHRLKEIYEIYKSELFKKNIPYREIKGIGKKRMRSAISEIDTFLGSR